MIALTAGNLLFESEVFGGADLNDGSFSSITGTDLGGGFSFDTSTLYTDGYLRVHFVPEPSSTALLGLVGLGFLIRRKR